MTDLKDKFIGCLLGCAVGDAVGAPVEAKDFQHCQRYVKHHVRPRQFQNIRRQAWRGEPSAPFGQITDDTQLTILLGHSLQKRRGLAPQHFADVLVWAFGNGVIVGSGRATKAAVARLAEGIPWDEAGTPSPAAGNGSAMRAAPMGMLYYDDLGGLAKETIRQGIVTHTNPECSAGAIAIAGAVAFSLQGRDPRNELWIADLGMLVDSHLATDFSKHLLEVWEWRERDPIEAADLIGAYSGMDPGRPLWDRISPYVLPSVMWAIYSFLHSPDDFWEVICTGILPGGDVDTTAAMAGAIAGAYNGQASIPREIVDLLQDNTVPIDGLLTCMAENLYALTMERT